MPNNLIVSYDLHAPNQNYTKVIEEIKSHGSWAKVHYSLFYLRTEETAQEVAMAIWKKMDKDDRLFVVNATTNDAYWYNLDSTVSEFVQNNWHN